MPAPKKTPENHVRDILSYAESLDVKLENVKATCVSFAERKWEYTWTYNKKPDKSEHKVCDTYML